MPIIEELKRRNVFRVGIAYLITAWLLAQILELLLDNFGAPAWAMKTILVVLAAGFPLALVFAWAFELTPEGIRRERDVAEGASVTAQTGRKLDRAIIVVLLLAVAWFAWDRHRLQQALAPGPVAEITSAEPEAIADADQRIPVVAVLPFKAMGSDDGGFLASGLHDDLLTRLAKLGAFRVISRTSMMEYADTAKNMRQIGQELGARYILEGGVQAMGGRVRINAQLIEAPTDEHLWAEIYDHELTAQNLFDVQAELAMAIAAELHTTLSPSDQALVDEVPTGNMGAYQAYLRGLDRLKVSGWVGTDEDRDAVLAFEEAVTLDPEFAQAWAALASARIKWAARRGFNEEDSEAALAALARARTLKPGMLESELAWAEYLYRFLNEFQQALDTLEALGSKAEGNIQALQLMAWLNRRLGRYPEAYEMLKQAATLAPRDIGVLIVMTHYAWLNDDCDTASRHLQHMNGLEPDAPGVIARSAEFEMECTGDAQRALELFKSVDFSDLGNRLTAYRAALKVGDADYLLALIAWDDQDVQPLDDVWDELNTAQVQSLLLGDEAGSSLTLDRAADMLNRIGNDKRESESDYFAWTNGFYHSLRGEKEQTRYWIDQARTRFRARTKGDLAEEAVNRFDFATAYARAGMLDEAVAELRTMLEEPGGHRFPYIDGWPLFEVLQNHPGFIELRERFGRQATSSSN